MIGPHRPSELQVMRGQYADPSQDWLRGLHEGSAALGIPLPPGAHDLFRAYMAELRRWRATINLNGFTTEQSILEAGFLDSLACLPALPPGPLRVVDIGSGAGFPGIPLRLARPDLSLTLIEANRRRHSFLAHVCRALGLADVRCLHGRAEAYAATEGLRGAFDAAFARAVRQVEEAAALAAGFLRPAGLFLSQQGGSGGARPSSLTGFGTGRAIPFTVFGRRGVVVAYAKGP